MQQFDWDSSVKMSKVMNMLEVGDEVQVTTKAGYSMWVRFEKKNPHLLAGKFDDDGVPMLAFFDTSDIAVLLVKVEGVVEEREYPSEPANLESKLQKAYKEGFEAGQVRPPQRWKCGGCGVTEYAPKQPKCTKCNRFMARYLPIENETAFREKSSQELLHELETDPDKLGEARDQVMAATEAREKRYKDGSEPIPLPNVCNRGRELTCGTCKRITTVPSKWPQEAWPQCTECKSWNWKYDHTLMTKVVDTVAADDHEADKGELNSAYPYECGQCKTVMASPERDIQKVGECPTCGSNAWWAVEKDEEASHVPEEAEFEKVERDIEEEEARAI